MSTSATAPDQPAHYAWAEHLIWMEGGEPVEAGQGSRPSIWPGLLLACGIAATAFGIRSALAAGAAGAARLFDPVLVSMLLGLAWGNLVARDSFLPGISVAVRKLLPFGIVLLGARMDFLEALRVGLPGLLLSIVVVLFAFFVVLSLGRRLGVDRDLAMLLGVGTGICGGTAIVAIAPILKARDRDVIVGVGLVTLIGLVAMLLLPALAGLIGFSQTQFGLLAGLTIHQTPQVIAAGFAYGEEAGQVATVAKLARVCLLAPVAVLIGWWVTRRRAGDSGSEAGGARRPWYRFLPVFAIGFLLLAGTRTLGLLPAGEITWSELPGDGSTSLSFDTIAILKFASSFLLAAGMVGVGYQTRLSQGRDLGWRPVVAAAAASALVGVFVILLATLFFT